MTHDGSIPCESKRTKELDGAGHVDGADRVVGRNLDRNRSGVRQARLNRQHLARVEVKDRCIRSERKEKKGGGGV